MTYESLPGVNFSSLKHIATSPHRYQFELARERTDSPHFRVGRLWHSQVLEPEKVDDEFVMYVGRRAGKTWDEFREEHADRSILSSSEWQAASGCSVSVLSSSLARKYLDAPGESELGLVWEDEETGTAMKGRIDRVGGGRLVDLKSTRSIEPRKFSRAFAEYFYHAQCALYLDGLRANGYDVTGAPVIIAVESSEPHDVVVYEIPEHVIEEGRRTYRRWLRMLIECTEKNSWPGVAGEDVLKLEIPEYAYSETLAETQLDWEGVA